MNTRDWQAQWQTFQGQAHTLGPTEGAVEQWHRGRDRWAVLLLRVTPPRRFAEAQAALEGTLTTVPAERCHVTLWVAGFVSRGALAEDEVDEDALTAVCESWQPAAPRLFVGAANSFASAAILEVLDPDGSLAALRAQLGELPEQRWQRYRPHLTLGTYTRAHPTHEVTARLASLRGIPPLPLTVTALQCVEISAQDPASPWRSRWQHRWS